MTKIGVHTSNFLGSTGNGHEQYATFLVLYWPNRIGDYYQPCGRVDDTSLWGI
jgi:hypothetical protein